MQVCSKSPIMCLEFNSESISLSDEPKETVIENKNLDIKCHNENDQITFKMYVLEEH